MLLVCLCLEPDKRYFAEHIRDDYANGALDGQVEQVLEEMKGLSIYGQ